MGPRSTRQRVKTDHFSSCIKSRRGAQKLINGNAHISVHLLPTFTYHFLTVVRISKSGNSLQVVISKVKVEVSFHLHYST